MDSLYYIAQLAGSEHWFMISVRRTYTHRTAIHGRRRWFFAMVILDWVGSWCLGLGAVSQDTTIEGKIGNRQSFNHNVQESSFPKLDSTAMLSLSCRDTCDAYISTTTKDR